MRYQELEKAILEFFHEQGKVYGPREWNQLGTDKRPLTPRQWKRYFGGKSYKQVLSALQRKYPVEIAAIGTREVAPPPPPPPPVVEPEEVLHTESPIKEAESEALSPIEKLRLATAGVVQKDE